MVVCRYSRDLLRCVLPLLLELVVVEVAVLSFPEDQILITGTVA